MADKDKAASEVRSAQRDVSKSESKLHDAEQKFEDAVKEEAKEELQKIEEKSK